MTQTLSPEELADITANVSIAELVSYPVDWKNVIYRLAHELESAWAENERLRAEVAEFEKTNDQLRHQIDNLEWEIDRLKFTGGT